MAPPAARRPRTSSSMTAASTRSVRSGRIGDARGVYHTLVAGPRRRHPHRRRPEHARAGAADPGIPGRLPRHRGAALEGHRRALHRTTRAAISTATIPPRDTATRLPGEPCPLDDLGIPVPNNSIYALALDRSPACSTGSAIRTPSSSPSIWPRQECSTTSARSWIARSIPARSGHGAACRARSMSAPDGRVYTSGEDGRIVYFDPASQKLVRTTMQIPGEYWEAWNYHGYPVIEQWVADAKGNLFGTTSDGYLFQMRAEQRADRQPRQAAHPSPRARRDARPRRAALHDLRRVRGRVQTHQLRHDRPRRLPRLGRADGGSQSLLCQARLPVRRDGHRHRRHDLHRRKRPPRLSLSLPPRR